MSGNALHRERTAWFGAVLGLGASAMFFAALLFGCVYLRVQASEPVPALPSGSRVLAVVACVLAIAAAAVLGRIGRGRVSEAAAEAMRRRGLGAGGIALGVAALGAEVALVVRMGSSVAGSYQMLLLTLICVLVAHAVVVLIGLCVGVARRAEHGFRTWALAWRYLAGVWTLVTVLAVCS